ncbi:group II intron maturase-specific domain-containing protein [Mycobacterium sp. ML4]
MAHPAPPQTGTSRSYVYVHPSTKAVLAVKRKLKTRRRTVEPTQSLDDLLRRINATLAGWAGYFKAGVSSATFSYLSHYTWQTVWRWMRRKHRKSTWKQLRRRYCGGGWWPATEERVLIDLEKIRYHSLPLPRFGDSLALATHR